jgi:hypothetical protein
MHQIRNLEMNTTRRLFSLENVRLGQEYQLPFPPSPLHMNSLWPKLATEGVAL